MKKCALYHFKPPVGQISYILRSWIESIILHLILQSEITQFKSNLVIWFRLKQVSDTPNNSPKSFLSPLSQKCYMFILRFVLAQDSNVHTYHAKMHTSVYLTSNGEIMEQKTLMSSHLLTSSTFFFFLRFY